MRIPVLLIVIIFIASCDDNKEVINLCPTGKSIDEFSWIVDLKNSMTDCRCEISIIKGTYKNDTVIFVAHTDALCDGIDTPTLYNCAGKVIKSFTSSMYDRHELLSSVTRDSVLYRCKD